MTSYSIKSVSEFINKISSRYQADDVLFRGQSQDWDLLPPLARLDRRDPIRTLPETEEKMFSDFKRMALPYLDGTPESDWDWISIARHHGLPTRVLDWTTNPLAALWFAVRAPAATDEDGDAIDGVVWAFECETHDYVVEKRGPFEQAATRVFQPRHITRRISAQAGWFTVHYMNSSDKFVPMQKNKNYKTRLRQFIIPADCFAEIRGQLDRCGINVATMLPGLDGLCGQISWQNGLLSDEFEKV